MSQYHYRFVIIYWLSYLEEFDKSCIEYLTSNTKEITELREFTNTDQYEIFRQFYEVPATSTIFYEKLGKHTETRKIFEILGFETVPPNAKGLVKMYRCKKNRERKEKVGKILELLKKIATMDI